MASLFLSAAHKSSGKTTVSIGICAALRERGINLQPFKKGPDYIDPIWLSLAAGKSCYNLDFFVAGRQETIEDYCRRGDCADLRLIEGNKGLYDGLDLDGSNSNAALAKAIQSPVIMVIDVRGTIRGIAPLLIGYQVFDKDVNIAGVIANRTGGERHESKLRAAVAEYTDIPFLGAIENDEAIGLDQRHLGLIPSYEDPSARQKIARIASAVKDNIDLDELLCIAQTAAVVKATTTPLPARNQFAGLRIGIAQDRAFGFYYPSDLEAFRHCGAELIPIDTLNDPGLPALDGLFIGGGFPERHAAELAANRSLRNEIHASIEAGLPSYVECGGLMYLSKRIHCNDEHHDMVGVIDADCKLYPKPQGRGYVKITESDQHPWVLHKQPGTRLHAHEFHYSSILDLSPGYRFAYQVERGSGIHRQCDGLVYRNLLAAYSHQRNTTSNPWVNRFLDFVLSHKLGAIDTTTNRIEL